MKKSVFVIVLAVVSLAATAAPTLGWDPSSGAEGYHLYCGLSPSPTPTPIDVGDVVSYDVGEIVSPGVEYECWVTAYAAGYPESAGSNVIRFTPPALTQTIVVPGQPSSVTILWD